MSLINPIHAQGFNVNLNITNPKHISDGMEKENPDRILGSFSNVLNGMMRNANELQHNSNNMLQRFIIDPESVDIHEVTIALTKAEDSINFLKSVSEKVISAYRTLTNLH